MPNTFPSSRGFITEEWREAPGEFGFPVWTATGLCRGSRPARQVLFRNSYKASDVKFTRRLGHQELIATPLNGGHITVSTITPHSGYHVRYTVKLDVTLTQYAGEQPSGDHAGYTIYQYTARFQQLFMNQV